MNYQKVLDLIASMPNPTALAAKIRNYASRVFLSRDTILLDGETSTDIVNRHNANIELHSMATGAAHGESLTTINAYSSNEIDTKVDDYLSTANVPISRFGDLSFLPPNILGGIQAIAPDFSFGSFATIEPNGTMSMLLQSTNSSVSRYYYCYVENAMNIIDNNLNMPNPVITNSYYKPLRNSEYNVLHLNSTNNDSFLWLGSRPETPINRKLFVTLVNGTLKPDVTIDYQIALNPPLTNNPSLEFNDAALSPASMNRWQVWRQVANGVKKIYLLYVNKVASTGLDNHSPEFTIYEANEPTDPNVTTITFNLMTGWHVTKRGGYVDNNTTFIKPYDRLAAPMTEVGSFGSIFNEEYIWGITYLTNSITYNVIRNESDTNEILLNNYYYIRAYAQSGVAITLVECVTFRINMSTKRIVNVAHDAPYDWGITKVPTSSTYNANDIRHAPNGRTQNPYVFGVGQMNGTTAIVPRPNTLIFIYGAQQGPFKYIQFFKKANGTIYDHYNAGVPDLSLAFNNGLSIGFGLPSAVTTELRIYHTINSEYVWLTGAGYTNDGNYRVDVHWTPVIARVNDGVFDDTIPSLNIPGVVYPSTRPMNPRVKLVPPGTIMDCIRNPGTVRLRNGTLGMYHMWISTAFGGRLLRKIDIDSELNLVNNFGTWGWLNDTVRLGTNASALAMVRSYDNYDDVVCNLFYPDHLWASAVTNTLSPLLIVEARNRTGLYVDVFVYRVSVTVVNSGNSIDITGVSIGSLAIPATRVQSNLRSSNLDSDFGYHSSNAMIVGSSYVHEFPEGFVIHFASSTGMQLSGTNTNGRYLFSLTKGTLVYNKMWIYASHISGTSLTHNSLPGGVGDTFGNGLGESDSGTKLVFRYTCKNWNDVMNFNENRYGNVSERVCLFSVKQPIDYRLTIPANIPATVNGQLRSLEPITFDIHDVCETTPLTTGRYYLYLDYDDEGDLKIVTNPAIVSDTTTRTRIGYVDFDENGITFTDYVKVTKVGKYRITDDPAKEIYGTNPIPRYTIGTPSAPSNNKNY